MFFKVLLTACVLMAAVSAIPQPAGGGWIMSNWPTAGANPWLPPWLAAAPWMPQWSPCTAIGTTCLDCNTKMVCTKIGGMQRACTDPTMPYCNLGECSATPTPECAPALTSAAVPA